MNFRYPLSLRQVVDLPSERGIDIFHEMAPFRGIKTLQKFTSAHASILNHFNLERHPIPSDAFKTNRSAAPAERRQRVA